MMDESLQEQATDYLLGQLSPTEAAAFERQLDADPALRAYLRERERDLEALTLEFTPQVDPPGQVRARLLAAVATGPRLAPKVVTVAEEASRRSAPPSAAWYRRFWPVLAGSVALLLLATGAGFALQRTRAAARREAAACAALVAQLRAENEQLRRRASDEAGALLAAGRADAERQDREAGELRAALARADQETAALRVQLDQSQREVLAAREQSVFPRLQVGLLRPAGLVPASTPATAAPPAGGVAVWDALRQQGMLLVENLPVPRPDQDYQVWVADFPHGPPVPSGVFHPVRPGARQTLTFVTHERVNRAAQFMVTLERRGGVSRITGPAVLQGAANP